MNSLNPLVPVLCDANRGVGKQFRSLTHSVHSELQQLTSTCPAMASIIKIYYYMCLAVGLINLRYDHKTESLQLYHWRTIIYVGVVNIIALVYQPIGIIIFFNTTYWCEEFDATALMNGFITLAYSLTIVATIIEAWLKRKLFQSVCYDYRRLVQQYLSESKINENREVVVKARNILMRKIMSSACRLVVLYIQLYNRAENDEYCAYMDETPYIMITIYLGFLNLMLILLDITVILGFVLIDLCLNMLLHTLERIEHDVQLMNRVYANGYGAKHRNGHRMWRLQLSEDIDAILNELGKCQRLAKVHTKIYQVPMMFMLLSVLLGLISLMFRILIYIDDFERFNLQTFIFLTIVVLANVTNSMILFDVCESLTQTWQRMSHQVHKIDINACLCNRGSFHRDHLEISLETLTLQLCREKFKVSICGMFDVHHSAGMAMLSKIVLYLISLVQSVVKEYNDYYNEQTNGEN